MAQGGLSGPFVVQHEHTDRSNGILKAQAMVPTLYQLSYETFRSQLPQLLAEGNDGKWALYHGESRIALNEDRDKLYEIAGQRHIPEDEIFVDYITLEADNIEQERILTR